MSSPDALIGVAVPAVIKIASPTRYVIKFELPEGVRTVKVKRQAETKSPEHGVRGSRQTRRSFDRFTSPQGPARHSTIAHPLHHNSLESAQVAADWDLLPASCSI